MLTSGGLATEACTIGERAVCSLLICFLFSNAFVDNNTGVSPCSL